MEKTQLTNQPTNQKKKPRKKEGQYLSERAVDFGYLNDTLSFYTSSVM